MGRSCLVEAADQDCSSQPPYLGKKKVLLWLWMVLLTEDIQAIKHKRKVCAMGASFCIAKQQDSRTDSQRSSQSCVAGGSTGVSSHSQTPSNPLYCLWWWSCCFCHGLHVALCHLLYTTWTDLERLCAHHSGSTWDRWRESIPRTWHPPHRRLVLQVLEIWDVSVHKHSRFR